jgi:hypothetical protein
MKTQKKSFDAVKFMREQRDRLDAMFAKMNKKEIVAYLNRAQLTSTCSAG